MYVSAWKVQMNKKNIEIMIYFPQETTLCEIKHVRRLFKSNKKNHRGET